MEATMLKIRDQRINNIDALRFILATWVVFSHGIFPPLFHHLDRTPNTLGWWVGGLYGGIFNGAAAVICFFIISGFCIHYPYREKKLIAKPFYFSRIIRIGIPWVVASLIAELVGLKSDYMLEGVVWSLVAECTYYTLYPPLYYLSKKVSWRSITYFFALISIIILFLVKPLEEHYILPKMGLAVCVLFCLPFWLMGCCLAEFKNKFSKYQKYLWSVRLTTWASASLFLLIRFNTPVGDPWLLPIFSLIAYIWLGIEISNPKPLPEWMQSMGKGSYSLYLFHLILIHACLEFFKIKPDSWSNWILTMCFLFLGCFGIYIAIEKPSHRLAQWLNQKTLKSFEKT